MLPIEFSVPKAYFLCSRARIREDR